MADLNLLINNRKYTRKLVTETFNNRGNFSTFTAVDRDRCRAQCNGYHKHLLDLNARIQTLKWNDDPSESRIEDEFKICEEYNSKIWECLSVLENNTLSTGAGSSVHDPNRTLLRRPIAPLPMFNSGVDEDLTKFFREFEETINKYSYPDYDKLLLLKQQITGRALTLVNSLESDRQGYTHAKSLLQKALASPDVQRFNIIKQLTEIKLDNSADPFEYISKMRLLTENVDKLNIDIKFLLQYFFWQGLNESFKNQLVLITNKTRPSLDEINEHFFEACERYRELQKRNRRERNNFVPSPSVHGDDGKDKDLSSVSLAAGVDYRSSDNSYKPCSICSKNDGKDANHPIFKCDLFKTPKDKLNQIHKLNGCVKCGNITHGTSSCRYRFKNKCRHCSAWHFSFLCNDFSGSADVTDNSKGLKSGEHINKPKRNFKYNKETSSHIIVAEALQNNPDSESILPTFTCEFEGNRTVRCLKDGGCQSNLISESLAQELNLKVINADISLTIKGINVSQSYSTKIVEVNVKVGDTIHTIEAVCIPNINISLNLPYLGEVVRNFLVRGYQLADARLNAHSYDISGISFILGTKSSYCIPITNVVFGSDCRSIYSRTPIGVMLEGNVDQIIQDARFLPYVGNVSTSVLCAGTLNVSSEQPVESVTACSVKLPVVSITDDNGKLIESELDIATNQVLDSNCPRIINYDEQHYEELSSEQNDRLIKYALDNTARDAEGRLVMPLLWNSEMCHLLAKNQNLSKLILKSNLNKLQKNPIHLKLMDEAFKEQEQAGIIERVDNVDQFLEEHPDHSFLPHMGVFKLSRETTKCRIVFLSNLCENKFNQSKTISHNQAIYSGPSLNQKISVALLHLRFGQSLLCFDIKKAFNNIVLNDVDKNRLLFFWYRNVSKNDFNLMVYRNVRLSFGLRCSPVLLLLGLYKILVLDAESDDLPLKNLKRQIYQLAYMDNCAVAMDDTQSLTWAYKQLRSIFEPYKFYLQQFVTNDEFVQAEIDSQLDDATASKVKLLGMQWNRVEDTISTFPIDLSVDADTKRGILRSIASQYDVFNFNGPILNRSRLFMHKLQCMVDVGWDTVLASDLCRQWRNIARQANASPVMELRRFVGKRDDAYRLIACSDSSKEIYGAVVYIQNTSTNEINFIMAKNRIVNKQLQSKSIPSLEIQGVALAAECIIDLYNNLTSPVCVEPINILDLQIYTDSLVALSWVNSYHCALDKMQKRSTFVLNRLSFIGKLCEVHPIVFSFVAGTNNPGDCITRSLSYKQLSKSNYFTGPDFLRTKDMKNVSREDILTVTVPHPLARNDSSVQCSSVSFHNYTEDIEEYVSFVGRFSTFDKLVGVQRLILIFVNKLKLKLKSGNSTRFAHLSSVDSDHNFHAKAVKLILRNDQNCNFPDVFKYFQSKVKTLKSMPNIVGQLNLYVDTDGLLRVHSKFNRFKDGELGKFPVLLSKNSPLTKLIILGRHLQFCHAGCYSLLSELRKEFYIPNYFSTVKRIIKSCVICRRFNERTIKINQSSYRDFRADPPEIPYSYLFMDHLGPFFVKSDGKKIKVWLLCITCMWSRAINVKICSDLSVGEFLRAFQLHCFEYGLPQYCISDLGSQLVAGANVILGYLSDPESKLYFDENGVQPISFDQFFKGHSQLGSMVECCVKALKKLIFSSIRNNVLSFRDFEFHISQTIHIVNRRPIAFKEALRDSEIDVPDAITPENLIRGYSLVSMNVIPDLHERCTDTDYSPVSPVDRVKSSYDKLQKVRSNLIKVYHSEFLNTLISQAVNEKDRYKPIKQKSIKKGDLVLVREEFTKPTNYPMGKVKDVVENFNGEVTGATILKGRSGEVIKRHVSTLIPLLECESPDVSEGGQCDQPIIVSQSPVRRSDRIAKLNVVDRKAQYLDN